MKVLFLTTGRFTSIYQRGIYPDLLRSFMAHEHEVFIVSSREKRENLETELIVEENSKNLCVKIGNLTQSNLIEKGLSTLAIEGQYKKAIKKYYSNVKFDLVIYSTPPITLASVVSYVKNRDKAKSYLLLKDIFPQNAVDLGLLKTRGVRGVIYKYFRKQEKKLYAISDRIGCMSKANVEYVLSHNIEISADKVEICPNCIEIQNVEITQEEKENIRIK